ncbi:MULTISPECIES: tRNA nucleotidyltransferase [unclassified Moraxella]|uniref:tRNA nucleotidyltransferase n=1 Tax=unclassified Moraxella TaxID=2685852 RepID=UPI00359E263A
MKVYLVGGAVRDALLGLSVKDKDFVVVGADFDTMKSLGFNQVGADFPVFLHPDTHFEYALARVERKNGLGYQGFSTDTKGISLVDDLLRRDLTINALAVEVVGLFDDTPKTGEVIDFYGGLTDLQNKTLRHISPAFSEDPLRILRTVRFLARYFAHGFKIADETIVLMQTMSNDGELSHLSRERLWAESVKAMENGTGHIYWQALKDLAILPHFLAELDACWQNDTVFKQAIDDLTLAKNCNIAVQFAILCSGYLGDDNLNKQLVAKIAHQLNTPKYPIQIANLLTEFDDIFNQKINATDVLNLIEKTKAHQGNTQTLNDVLTTIFIIHRGLITNQNKIAQMIHQAIKLYKSVSINDISPQLTGREIHMALSSVRQDKIKHLINEYFSYE